MEVAIIGGGAAGMTAASRIRALKPDWKVMVFEKSSFVSHAPCGIPFYVGGAVDHFDELCAYDVEYFRVERGIDVHIHSRVVGVEEGLIFVEENGREKTYEWDKLLFATGSRAQRLNVTGEELDGVLCVSDVEMAQKVKMAALKSENVVIIGSGYIGIEMADAISRLGKKVTIIEVMERPLPE